MFLFDTYTRKKRKFEPLKDKRVRLYACGPTVYSDVHIGNLSTFIFVDFLIRYLKYQKYQTKYVRNITDVGHLTGDSDTGEDKLERASRKEGIKPLEIAKKYIRNFHTETKALNLLKPDQEPRASQYIPEQIQAVKDLIKKGFAYETSSGVYFDISKDLEYGRLARSKIDNKSTQSRICAAEDKKHPMDFALWIKAVGKHKKHLQNWDSPWGKGFPGWHLECSIMSQKLLGKEFDIHCGGIDLASVHHVNEIAQSKALYGVVPARFWIHKEHLQIGKTKMAKSTGNFFTLADLEKSGYSPDVFKFFVLSTHYRGKLKFSKKALDQAQKNFHKIRHFLNNYQNSQSPIIDSKAQREIEDFWQNFEGALDDDLNTPKVLTVIFDFIKTVEKQHCHFNCRLILEKFRYIEKIFGINLIPKSKTKELPAKIQELINERRRARNQKDFIKADQIRNTLEKQGILIQDEKDKNQKVIYKNEELQ